MTVSESYKTCGWSKFSLPLTAMQPLLTAILLGGTLLLATPAYHLPDFSHRSPPSPPLSGKHGGVAAEVGECSDIGVNILKAGGNAADAIISSALCVGTIAGYHSGIGGGGFMLVRFNNDEGDHSYEMVSLRLSSSFQDLELSDGVID